MRWLDALVLLYGILLIGMGIYGYTSKGSWISLISGGAAGALVIGFAALTTTNPRVGRIGSAVIALLMMGKFIPACFGPTKKWDFELLAVSSGIVFVCLLGGHFYAMSKRKSASQAT